MIDCVACGLVFDIDEIRWLDGEPHCEECHLYEKHDGATA